MDMFADELEEGLKAEIERLKGENAALEKDCIGLNHIYCKFWGMAAEICSKGTVIVSTENRNFADTYEAMHQYDSAEDLRDKYPTTQEE